MSRSYIQTVREKASGDEKEVVAYTLFKTLTETLKLFAPVAPFITERIWQNLRKSIPLEESVHLCEWPKADEKLIDKKLEKQMKIIGNITQSVLSAREKARISLRWPIKSVHIVSKDNDVLNAARELSELLKKQLNAKEIHSLDEFESVKTKVDPDPGVLGKAFGAKSNEIKKAIIKCQEEIIDQIGKDKFIIKVNNENIELSRDSIKIKREVSEDYSENEFKGGFVYVNTKRTAELESEGYARELMRNIQSMRKDAGLKRADRINLHIQASEELIALIKPWIKNIKEKCGAEITTGKDNAKEYKYLSEEKIKNENIKIFF